MQTTEKRRSAGGGLSGAAYAGMVVLFALALSACGGDDDRCDRSFSTEEVEQLYPALTNPIVACNTLAETPSDLNPIGLNCKQASYGTCEIAAGTGSGATSGVGSVSTPDLTEAQCNQRAQSSANQVAVTRAQDLATAEAARIAAPIAAGPRTEFECGGFTQTHKYDYTTGDITVVYTPSSCNYAFTDIPDAASCTGIQTEFGCATSAYAAGTRTCTVRTCSVCDNASDVNASACLVTIPINVEITEVDVTVTACQICDPPKGEPRCRLTGCLDCAPLDPPNEG